MKSMFMLCLLIVGGIMLTESCRQTTPVYPQGLLGEILADQHPVIDQVFSDAAKYRVQLLYTQIDRDEKNVPAFTSFRYGLSKDDYFYPASSVKFPAAVLALEKLNNLSLENVNKYTWVRIDSAFSGQQVVWEDSSAIDGKPTIAHYIKKVFLVSDNDAFNRLYEFLGQQYLNETLWNKGYDDVKIIRRLSIAMTPEENAATNPFLFYGGENIFYDQPLEINAERYTVDMNNIRQGRGVMRGGELLEEPIDFTHSNYISVESLQGILKAVYFPQAVPEQARFNLSEADYQFLYKYMSMLPRESRDPVYADRETYYDSYVKYVMYADRREPLPDNVRIFNKVGSAYGYLIENAYVADFDNQVEFMLTAVLHVNENQVFNDDTYEYDTIGHPFLGAVGRAIYQHELQRPRAHRPDLTRFDPRRLPAEL